MVGNRGKVNIFSVLTLCSTVENNVLGMMVFFFFQEEAFLGSEIGSRTPSPPVKYTMNIYDS